jgi:CheY-like chemotaxis protein
MNPSTCKFIVAGDSASARDSIIDILRGAGAREIARARDGAEAFDLVARRKPHALILDLELLHDTVRTVRQVRLSPFSLQRELPVIALTAYATRAQIMLIRNAGATAILSKPISSGMLLARLKEALTNPRPFIESALYTGPDRRRPGAIPYDGPLRRFDDVDAFDVSPVKFRGGRT